MLLALILQRLKIATKKVILFYLPIYLPFLVFFILLSVLSPSVCPTLCTTLDCSPQGTSVHRILQARILEWVTISFYGGSSQPRDQTHVSYVSCIAGGFFIL